MEGFMSLVFQSNIRLWKLYYDDEIRSQTLRSRYMMSETPEQPIKAPVAPVAPVSAPVVPVDASNQLEKFKGISGPKKKKYLTNPLLILSMRKSQIAAKEEEVPDPGDSLLTATTLPGVLPNGERGADHRIQWYTNPDFSGKGDRENGVIFDSISELSPTSAAKWHEVKYSKRFLKTTTKNIRKRF